MLPELPTAFGALCALAFVLGLKHGLDADHLAAIDGLTRLAAGRGQRRARWTGALFAAGHGAAVMGFVVAFAALRSRWPTPAWLDATGSALSLSFLLALGIANLRLVLAAPPDQPVPIAGLRTRWLVPALRGSHPLAAAAVGALFAVSFDTVSQAALFALAGSAFGAHHALALGLLFAAGMAVVGAANGWWVWRLLERTDRLSLSASRVMSAAVAAISLLTAALGIARWLSPRIEAWAESRASLFAAVVVVVMLASAALAQALARRSRRRWAWRAARESAAPPRA